MKTYKMRQYYVAYDYGLDEVECIDGPYATYVHASDARARLVVNADDDMLIIVCHMMEVSSL